MPFYKLQYYVISDGKEYKIVDVLPGRDPCFSYGKSYSVYAGPFKTWLQAYDAIPESAKGQP